MYGLGLLADTASAQTVEQLKKELAVKNAEIARLSRRVRELEGAGAPVVPMEPAPYPPRAQYNSTVFSLSPPLSVAAGNPARVVRNVYKI